MRYYDVTIIGAGPAGGQCAKELTKKGHSVLLVEQYKRFEENNFSSAGMTLVPLEKFNIPKDVIGTYWKNLLVQCSKKGYWWRSDVNNGVVLDFGRLRQFLANECTSNGGEVLMGHRYMKKEVNDEGCIVHLKNIETKEVFPVRSRFIVDATGPSRKVIIEEKSEMPKLLNGLGLEYLIEVEKEVYDTYKDSLVFFLGDKWAPGGYSWIFPMEEGILKVGSGKIIDQDVEGKKDHALKDMIDKIIDEYLCSKSYKILDKHGNVARYSLGLKDTFYKDKIVAIGDAVSTINPLGGEGIQYAMENGKFAADYIDRFLRNKKVNFKEYQKKWRKKYYLKWSICEEATKRMYTKYDDEKIESRVDYYHKNTDVNGLIDVLFNFKLNRVIPTLMKSFFYKLLPKFVRK